MHKDERQSQALTYRTPKLRSGFTAALLLLTALEASAAERAASSSQLAERHKVIIDTDIGSDVDDAFAVALALSIPEFEILGFTTDSGNTTARAKILDRMLSESGHSDIPVAVGRQTKSPNDGFPTTFIGPQTRYGEKAASLRASYPSATDFILEQIHRFPGQVTLLTIGPVSNIGDLIDKDVASFRKLKRVVMMGGWFGRAKDAFGDTLEPGPEYNIQVDIEAAQKLFKSGVPLYVITFDSTIHLALDDVKRRTLFSRGEPLTNSLSLLYVLWGNTTPVFFDPMAVAFVTNPSLCPVEHAHVEVDDKGATRTTSAPPNAFVCLRSDAHAFFAYYMGLVVPSRESHR